jgi:hypothetical protein
MMDRQQQATAPFDLYRSEFVRAALQMSMAHHFSANWFHGVVFKQQASRAHRRNLDQLIKGVINNSTSDISHQFQKQRPVYHDYTTSHANC